MFEEARASADAVAAQASEEAALKDVAQELRALMPSAVVTVARGSSDHAASYLAWLITARLGLPVASLPMSQVTLNGARMKVPGQLAIGISQSGRSPDLVATIESLREGGAYTLAMVNVTDSPLVVACARHLPLCAGAETSVAATKSYIASLSMAARLVAHWHNDADLLKAIDALPAALRAAADQDWSAALPKLRDARHMVVIGRGRSLAIAQEAALKFKETCAIQAEAFSGAEFRHGPMALVEPGFTVLAFAPQGPEQADLLEAARDLRARGATVLLAATDDVADRDLTLVRAPHDDLAPLTAIQSFYLMVEALARLRGRDPDAPPHLQKVTCTR